MLRFIQGIYRASRSEDDLFGLRYGQMRNKRIVNNGGWYNEFGEKIGCGDLAAQDFETVRNGLKNNEMFVVLSEGDAYWSFRIQRKRPLWQSQAEINEEAPGIDYVAKRCRYIVTGTELYCVYDHVRSRDDAREIQGLHFKVISRKEAKKLFPRRRLRDVAFYYLEKVLG